MPFAFAPPPKEDGLDPHATANASGSIRFQERGRIGALRTTPPADTQTLLFFYDEFVALALLMRNAMLFLWMYWLENALKTRRLYPFVGSILCGCVLVLFVNGCGVDAPCTVGDRRCNGAEIEECTSHPSGVDVSADPVSVSHHHSSPNDWYAQGSCGSPALCQTGTYTDEYNVTKADAFCSLDPTPDTACKGSSSYACTGSTPVSTLVTCSDGFAIERQTCASCDDTLHDCKGGIYAACAVDTDCASGLYCDSQSSCAMACSCPEGSPCAACNVLDEMTSGPTQGTPSTWICRAGSCFQQFSE